MLKRAWAHLEWGGKANEDKALADAVKVIELEPANGSAHYARGKVYFNRASAAKKEKNLKEALDLFGKALADYEVARVAYPELFAEYERQKRGFSCGNAPRTWHLAGYFYWSHSHPDLAIQCFSRALDLGHDPFEVNYFRSNAYAAQGDFVSAIADADNAVKLSHGRSGYENRAEIYEKKGDLDKAIADFMTVERQLLPGPQKAGLYRKIAAVYELKGDARNAARYRQKAQDEDRGVKK